MAFLRLKRRRKGNETCEYWTVVESFRTARGPRQRTLAVLGKAPGLDTEERVGWEDIAAQLWGRAPRPAAGRTGGLFDPPGLEAPEWAEVDLGRVRVERGRRFGDVYLALALWRRPRPRRSYPRRRSAACPASLRKRFTRIECIARSTRSRRTATRSFRI